MPCKPDQEDISGNEEDMKTYRSFEGWRCGKRGAATSGAFVVELVKKPANAEVAMVPQNYVKLQGSDARTMLKLMEALDDHDDVQHVWANFDIEEKEIEASLA